MDFNSSVLKEVARDALNQHWGKSVLTTLCASVLGAFCTMTFFLAFFGTAVILFVSFFEGVEAAAYFDVSLIAIVIALLYFFIGAMVRYGYIEYTLALLDRRPAAVSMIFSKTDMVWKGICMKIMVSVVQWILTLLFIIPGVIAHYSFAMTPYILSERKDYSVKKAMKMSAKIMKGYKWRLFCLRFSFLGWKILGVVTCGIGMLFVKPYQQTAEAVLYNEISGRAKAYYHRSGFE